MRLPPLKKPEELAERENEYSSTENSPSRGFPGSLCSFPAAGVGHRPCPLGHEGHKEATSCSVLLGMALDVECSGCRRGLTAGEDIPCGPSEGTEGPGCPSLCPLKDSDPGEGTGSVPWARSAESGLSWAEILGFAPYKSIPTALTRPQVPRELLQNSGSN